MPSYTNRGTPGVAMMIVGGVMVVAAACLLLFVDDSFPMWLLVAGAGLMFLSAGAAARSDQQ
ncbi:MAG: hypothetical protein WBO21_07495 [Acidimicrobiia bacterium]